MTFAIDSLRMGGEIEFCIEDVCGRVPCEPSVLPTRHECWTDTGRSALLLTALDILERGGKPVAWLPAFCCEAATAAFVQAGFSVRHYSAGEVHGEACRPPDPQPGETLVFVHYFGRRNDDRLRQAEHWRNAGVVIVEDAVQAAMTAGLGTAAYTVTSLRKFFAQPDGAMLGSDRKVGAGLAPSDESFVSARAMAKLARGAGGADDHFLPLVAASEAALDHSPIVPRRMSWLSRQLMARTDRADVASRRRRNHRALYAGLGRLSMLLRPILGELREDEVPLGLAVRVSGGRRDRLRQFLAQHRVYCAIHWPLPHVPKSRETQADHRLAEEIITLPIDQRMDERHVLRLLGLLETFVSPGE